MIIEFHVLSLHWLAQIDSTNGSVCKYSISTAFWRRRWRSDYLVNCSDILDGYKEEEKSWDGQRGKPLLSFVTFFSTGKDIDYSRNAFCLGSFFVLFPSKTSFPSVSAEFFVYFIWWNGDGILVPHSSSSSISVRVVEQIDCSSTE